MKTILHILGTAEAEGAAQARTTQALYGELRDRYRFAALFIGKPGPLAGEMESAGIAAAVISPRGRYDIRSAWRLGQFLRRGEFALVHQQLRSRRVMRAVQWTTRAPLLLHVCSYIAEPLSVQPERIPVDGADAVVANSQIVARWIDGAKPPVIYPGIPVRPRPASRREAGVVRIGCAARLVSTKGIDYLLRAVASLAPECPALRVEIAGVGPDRSRLDSLVRELQIESAVNFLGWQPEVFELSGRWDIYVQPSLAEAFGMAVVEAMMAGLPVIGTTGNGLADVIEQERTGILVAPGDAPALASALRRLLQSPALSKQFGDAGRERAVKEFSAAKMAAGFSKLYEELLARA